MPTVPGQRFAGKHNNAPAPLNGKMIVPADIAEDDIKMELWTLIVEDLKSRNLWSPTYTVPVQLFVETLVRYREVRDIIDEEGVYVDKLSITGVCVGSMQHPLSTLELGLSRKLDGYFEKFGMTPKDIVFLSQTDPTPDQVIESTVADNAIQYFR